MGETSEARSGSKAIERAMAILDCFAVEGELSPSEVVVRTGLPVSTTHRIMHALSRKGYLCRGESGTYRVGAHLADLVPRPPVIDEAAPHLHALAAGIKITAHFGVIENTTLTTLVSARPPVPYCAIQIPDQRELVRTTAMGKAILAFDPGGPRTAVRRHCLSDPHAPGPTASELLADLSEIRRLGFAVSDGENAAGVWRAVAIPVLGSGRRPIGAIGVRAHPRRMTDRLVESLVPAMRHFATEISRRLGDEHLIHS